ncbi:MAG TPA: S41 family peptidase [Thermoanaerobaculia bacterium]|nr:S41 family peptidase [Thermoanaerobaculia bacterium]
MRKFSVALLWILLGTSNAALATPANEPARRLAPEGARNLEAFTRLLGYVRFFHPSDQAAAADWDRVAIAGVQAVEDASGAADLALTLEDFFRPLAPTLRVYPEGQRPALPAELLPPPGVENPDVTFWHHRGVGLPGNTIPTWSSSRLVFPNAPPANSFVPGPGEPLEVSLGGGVSALVPLSLYKNAFGTIPPTSAPAPAPEKPAGFLPSGNDRVTRLAGVALAWPVFQHFYPYFDIVPADWPAELRKALSSAAEDADERAFVDTLRRMMAALEDGHARVSHRSYVLSHQIPLTWDWIDDRVVITHADPLGAPGLTRGDIVLTIDNRPAGQVFQEHWDLAPGASFRHRRWRALQTMALGAQNEEVRLRVLKHHGGVDEVTVRRTFSVPGGPGGRPFSEPRPEKIAEIQPGILYVDLDRINDDDFYAAFDQLAAAQGIIFDLRGYPWEVGLDAIVYMLDRPARSAIFNVPLTHRPDRQWVGHVDVGWPLPNFLLLPAPRVFITDGRAISYAETWMAFVEEYELGEIVGEATSGTNGTINFVFLPGGYSLRFTGMRVLKHDGTPHHGVGILPTVPVSRTLAGIREGRDEFLEKAIEVVNP